MMPAYVSRDFPEPLRVLPELALDLHWTWSHAGDALWKTVSPATWGRTRNPWAIVQDLSQERLAPLTQDTRFLDELQRLLEAHWHAIRFWTAEQQRYLCQSATYATGSFLLDSRYQGRLPEVKHHIIAMSLTASGVCDLARVLRVSTDTGFSELKKKAAALEFEHDSAVFSETPFETICLFSAKWAGIFPRAPNL